MPKCVFVLGAGFTRAFLPCAPLIEDDYDGERLLAECEHLIYARGILDLELKTANAPGISPRRRLNLERLMTRLQGRMPYDLDTPGATEELDLLLINVTGQFIRRLREAGRPRPPDSEVLARFAEHCVRNAVNCITFNYDDVLDEVLWNVKKSETGASPRWGPTGGYGFFCKTSEECHRAPQIRPPLSASN